MERAKGFEPRGTWQAKWNASHVERGKPSTITLARLGTLYVLTQQEHGAPRSRFKEFLMFPSLAIVWKWPLVNEMKFAQETTGRGALASLVFGKPPLKIGTHSDIDFAGVKAKSVNNNFTHKKMERAKGFEPSTITLAR